MAQDLRVMLPGGRRCPLGTRGGKTLTEVDGTLRKNQIFNQRQRCRGVGRCNRGSAVSRAAAGVQTSLLTSPPRSGWGGGGRRKWVSKGKRWHFFIEIADNTWIWLVRRGRTELLGGGGEMKRQLWLHRDAEKEPTPPPPPPRTSVHGRGALGEAAGAVGVCKEKETAARMLERN